MDNIIAILTVCVTFLLGIMGLIANSMIQRKSNSISVITGTRLERRKTTQELAAKLLRYGDAEFLKTAKLTTEGKRIKLETVGKTKKGSKSYQTWEAIWKANAKQYKGK